jgi:hypothetical protein
MKPRSYYLLFLGLLVGFLTMDYFLNQKIIQLKSKTSTTAKNLNNADSITKPEITVAAVEKTPVEESALDSVQQFKSEFRQEVSQIGRVQTDTEAVENRLQAVARQMEPEHLKLFKNDFK